MFHEGSNLLKTVDLFKTVCHLKGKLNSNTYVQNVFVFISKK